jgi:hypothetical protein
LRVRWPRWPCSFTVAISGAPKAATETPLTLTVTRDGKPVNDLQPYLDTYAHVTAIHAGGLALAHLQPSGSVDGDHGGPMLTVQADRRAPRSPVGHRCAAFRRPDLAT